MASETPSWRPIVRYLGLRDFLTVASEVTGADCEELSTESVLQAAKLALDPPAAATTRARRQTQDLYDGLPVKAAVLVEGLLTAPPLQLQAAQIAFGCLVRFLEVNHAEWRAESRLTVLRFEEVRRQPTNAQRLYDWVTEQVVISAPPAPGRRRRSGAVQDQLFEPLGTGTFELVFFLAGPLLALSPEERQRLRPLNAAVRRGLIAGTGRLGHPCRVRLEHPSLLMPPEEAPSDDRELWEHLSRLVLEQVDALIVSDVALTTAGFGAACELGLHALHGEPVLYLHHRDCRPSRYLVGQRAELPLDVVSYVDLERVPQLVRRWVQRRGGRIADAARRRDDRDLLYRPLQRRLKRAWSTADRERAVTALDSSGHTPAGVNRLLTSVAALAAAPAHRRDALCRMLGVAPTDPAPSKPASTTTATDESAGLAALLQAAAEEEWDAPTIFALRDHALRRFARPRSHAARRPPREAHDWVVLHRELGL